MKHLLSFLLLFCTFNALGQTIGDIYGEWKFESVAEVYTDKKGDVNKLSSFMDKLFFHFYPDGTYEAGLMGMAEAGKFVMEGDKIITNNGTSKSEVTLIAATPEKLTLKIRSLAANLTKVPLAGDKLLLAKNWKLTGIRTPGDDIREINDKSTLVFNANGTYSVALGATKEAGRWDYGDAEGKKTVILNAGGRSKYWPLVSVDSKQLVLVLSSNGQEFIFTAP